MNILVLGGGGREHALCWRLAQTPGTHVWCAPGNPGTAQVATNLGDLNPLDFPAVVAACQQHSIGLVVVGPEEPLVRGVADALRKAGIAVVGPSAAAAQLEGSKAFSKSFMQRWNIPTARYASFGADQLAEAQAFAQSLPLPVVVKASGLAAGKGVIIAEDYATADQTLADMLTGAAFGEAGETVVVEEFLHGTEVSCFALCNGEQYALLPSAKDYKRIHEGDKGPNTGGMGAVSPVPFAEDAFLDKVRKRVLEPTLLGLAKEGMPFNGFLFMGLMCVNGEPVVVEYNVRLGDPETEAILPRIKGDFAGLCQVVATGKGLLLPLATDARSTCTVVVVSGGYPGDYAKGTPIEHLPDSTDDLLVFHAGTRTTEDETLQTNGGRVVALTALADTSETARERAQQAAAEVQFAGAYFRRDIGSDLS